MERSGTLDWNERYSGEGYFFGTAPSQFLARHGGLIPPGSRVLCVADGEGRNSVYLARAGHRVCAFDYAPAAVSKARALAREQGVEVELHTAGIEGWDWSRSFDVVAGVFVQFATPPAKARLLDDMARAVAPGGLLMLHGYVPRQREEGYRSGGPGLVENLYTLDELRRTYPGWEELVAEDYDAQLEEGEGHSGRSALVDFIARKPT